LLTFGVNTGIIRKLQIIILACLALTACEFREVDRPDDPPYICPFEVSDSNIITEIYEGTDTIFFTLEDNSRFNRLKNCFQSYTIDSANWTFDVIFKDSTIQQSYPFLGNRLRIPEDSILHDPNNRAPLSALVKLSLPVPGKVRITVHGRTPASPSISHVFEDYKSNHSIPVHGMYADFLNKISITILDLNGNERTSDTIHIQTGELGVIQTGDMRLYTNNYTAEQKDRLFLFQNAIYDTEGYIRWYTTFQSNKYFPMSGDQIALQAWPDKGAPVESIEIRMINLMGELLIEYDVPNRNHHEIFEKSPGGNLLVASNAQPYNSTLDDTEDMIVEIDRESGEVAKTWDLRDIYDQTRPRLWTEMPNDWCHLNSIEYDSSDNTLLISSKLQYFVSKIDYDSGDIKWIFGNHENWEEAWQEYLLTPVNFDTTIHADRDWVYAQHMPRMTSEGTVIVYDNGSTRPGGEFTRAIEFRVDTSNMTVEKVWTYDCNFVTRTMGSVQVFEDGNVLLGHGEKGRLTEVDRDGNIVFDARLLYFYRAYPVKLYGDINY